MRSPSPPQPKTESPIPVTLPETESTSKDDASTRDARPESPSLGVQSENSESSSSPSKTTEPKNRVSDDTGIHEDVAVVPALEQNAEEESEPPPPVDTSEVLLKLKPLLPPDAAPTSDPPPFTEAKTLSDALRSVVMTRLMCDRQTRDEVVNPVLMANQATAALSHLPPPPEYADSTPESLIEEVLGRTRREARLDTFNAVRPSLTEHFERRQESTAEKIDNLNRQYLKLNEKWKAHCAALNEQHRSMFSSDHDSLQHSGRTTRRTTAITDAVRSDLEMEQIIASLGNDDAVDPNFLSMRNAATIPDMISVTQGSVDYMFDDTNHLIENPTEYYAPDTGIDDWTDDEKRIFIDRFAQFPKQFGIIAQSLPHKTASQCVDYYYLHKKRQIDFRKVVAQLGPKKRKRRGGGKKKGNALLTDIAQHDAEVGKNLSAFVVPSRVAKGRRGGRPPKVSAALERAGNSATATPQPEPRNTRLNSQLGESSTTPATPEPERRVSTRRQKPISTSISASGPSLSALSIPPNLPDSESVSASVASPAPIPSPDVPTPASDHAPTPISISTAPSTVQVIQLAASHSGSSAPPKTEEDEPNPESASSRPTKRSKRKGKQVKSVAIIHEEPPSPPAESSQASPIEPTSGLPEPSQVLTKATKILSQFETRKNGKEKTTASRRSGSRNGRHSPIDLEGDLSEAEKSRWP
ncbi:hypothetical protein H1R20_g11688, partial [Candolleomyces eurysporus]